EAALFNHNYIGTEHLLMGLLREGKGIAATVLRDLGIELAAVHAFVEHVVGRGTPQPEEVQRPLVPRVQAVLMLAVSEAWRSQYMDTEHLLIGLVREGEGIAAGALETRGAPLEQVRMRTYQAILSRGTPTKSLKTVIKNKSNV